MPEVKNLLEENCASGAGPMNDMEIDPASGSARFVEDAQTKQGRRRVRREQQNVVRDTITALALCHNVTPTYPDPSDHSIRDFQASSPDEIALVKFADSIGMKLIERDQNVTEIENAAGVRERYTILANFPFSSDTKRMGIVLQNEATGKIIFYLKGAEVVMKAKVKAGQRATVDEACENLALDGLRTLVISQKLISKQYFE